MSSPFVDPQRRFGGSGVVVPVDLADSSRNALSPAPVFQGTPRIRLFHFPVLALQYWSPYWTPLTEKAFRLPGSFLPAMFQYPKRSSQASSKVKEEGIQTRFEFVTLASISESSRNTGPRLSQVLPAAPTVPSASSDEVPVPIPKSVLCRAVEPPLRSKKPASN